MFYAYYTICYFFKNEKLASTVNNFYICIIGLTLLLKMTAYF